MTKELESKLQRRCQSLLKNNGAFVFKTHGDMYARVGIPDLVACIPVDIDTLKELCEQGWLDKQKIGIFVSFEVKRENQLGDVSKAQMIVGNEIKNAGGMWYAIDDSDYVEAIIEMMRGKLK